MSEIRVRSFGLEDVFRLNRVNLDEYTTNFRPSTYFDVISSWPEFCHVAEAPDGTIVGYITGKIEYGTAGVWHGHVNAVSVAPAFRRCNVANRLMHLLEKASFVNGARFVDLFVRVSNERAIRLYEARGYSVHQRLSAFYEDGEDALEMRITSIEAEKRRRHHTHVCEVQTKTELTS